ncbi:hypothetical protein JHK87_031301 [Glycine soja]|nr:hypothetical protein JHK87_031301 [Glycine soja]
MANCPSIETTREIYRLYFDEGETPQVMDEGPWMLFNHYLTVQHWTPKFLSPTIKAEKTFIWIRFPGLNLLYYDENILLALVETIGNPVRVDSNMKDI